MTETLTLFEDREASRVSLPGEGRPAPSGVNVSTSSERRASASRSLEVAQAERDVALVRVESAAPVEWKVRAWEWLVAYLETNAEFFPDDVWAAGLTPPPERRAFGPLVQRAAREGLIVRTDRLRPRTLGHATPAPVWRSTCYRQENP